MTAKIYEWPRSAIKYVRDPVLLETERRKAQIITRETSIDQTAAAVINQLTARGYPVKNQYDIGLLIEVLRSLIMRTQEEPHPLQVMADDVVVVLNPQGQRVNSDGSIYVEEEPDVPRTQVPAANT